MERIWLWRIWCNIYANHVKKWSLKIPKLCSSSFSWHYFCFHKHFCEGPCLCRRHFGRVVSYVGEIKLWGQRKRFGWRWWMSLRAGQGQQRFPSRRDVPLLDAQSGSQNDVESSVLNVELDRCWKCFDLPFGPQEQKELTFWWKSDWLKRMKKCVNRAQLFVEVSKRGLNSKPDFYLPEYLLNVMKQKDEIDVKL